MSKSKVVQLFKERTTCGTCELRGKCLWKECSDADARAALDFDILPRLLREGDQIFRAGDEFHSLHVVRSGAVKTFVVLENGDEQVTGFYFPGDVFGVEAIDVGRYDTYAVALGTTTVCALPYRKLGRACQHSASVQRRVMGCIAHAARRWEELLTTLGTSRAQQRVARFLTQFAQQQREHGFSGYEFSLPMKWGDIASYLALAPETLSRVLTRLQTAGILRIERHEVTVLSPEQLRQNAGLQAEMAELPKVEKRAAV